jgi:hypothetical protein
MELKSWTFKRLSGNNIYYTHNIIFYDFLFIVYIFCIKIYAKVISRASL